MSDSMAGTAGGDGPHDPEPRPLGVVRTPTGNADVDGQLARLDDVDHLPTEGHVEVYEDVHRGLRDTLTALDARPAHPGPPAPAASSSPSPASFTYDHRS